jgi:hypothetical protein
MLFRLIQKVADLWFSKEEDRPVVFVYQGEKDKIVLSSLTPTQGEESKKRFICETVIERRANEKIRAGFERLGEGYYSDPEILEPKRAELERLCAKGEISGYDLPYDILPKNLLDYVQEMRNQLGTLSKRTVDTLRWRGGIDGPPNPFSESIAEWSFDGSRWNELPGRRSIRFRLRRGFDRSERAEALVQAKVEAEESEPLGHELLREAYAMCNMHPRSAFLLAMTSAETGIKQAIVALQPDTKWLVENAPSPDIVKLLRDYFPQIPPIKSLNGRILFPKKTILEPLKKCVQMRNILAHNGRFDRTAKETEEILDNIHDLLWLLDFYCGHDWALQYLDSECSNGLCEEVGVKKREFWRRAYG